MGAAGRVYTVCVRACVCVCVCVCVCARRDTGGYLRLVADIDVFYLRSNYTSTMFVPAYYAGKHTARIGIAREAALDKKRAVINHCTRQA